MLTCRRKACSRKDGSVRALRSIRVSGSVDTEITTSREGEESSNINGKGKLGKSTGNAISSGVVSNTTFGDSLFGAKPSSSTSNSTAINPFGAPSSKQNPFSSSSTLAAANPFSVPSSSSQRSPTPSEALPPASSSTYDTATNRIANTLPQSFTAALSLNNSTTSKTHAVKDTNIEKPIPIFGPPEPYPPPTSFPTSYPKLYLDASYEALDATTPASKTEIQKYTIDTEMDIDTENSSSGKNGDKKGSGRGGKGEKEDKDTFESSIDGTFQKFADRLAQNPEQVLRYEFEGAPLLYSKSDTVGKMLSASSSSGADANVKVKTVAGNGKGNGENSGMPSCFKCGAARVFELQMTPHAILELEDGDEYVEDNSKSGKKSVIEGMEWGTLIVGVCSRDCAVNAEVVDDTGNGGNEKDKTSRVGWVEEWVGVQWEEAIAERR